MNPYWNSFHYKEIQCSPVCETFFYTGYGIFNCDSMKQKVILKWITRKYAISRMKMPHIQVGAISVISCFSLSRWKLSNPTMQQSNDEMTIITRLKTNDSITLILQSCSAWHQFGLQTSPPVNWCQTQRLQISATPDMAKNPTSKITDKNANHLRGNCT